MKEASQNKITQKQYLHGVTDVFAGIPGFSKRILFKIHKFPLIRIEKRLDGVGNCCADQQILVIMFSQHLVDALVVEVVLADPTIHHYGGLSSLSDAILAKTFLILAQTWLIWSDALCIQL